MSEATDKAEFRRKKIIEYNSALADFKLELQEQNARKKDRILQLAKILEEAGYDKQKISSQVTHDLKDEVSAQYVRKILGDDYKDKTQIRATSCANNVIEESSTSEQQQKKQALLVTNNGETEQETSDQKSEYYDLDDIHGGKSLSQMQREANMKKLADDEIDEEMEETLENPQNSVGVSNGLPLLTSIPPELREKIAAFDAMKQAFEEQKEIADKKSKDFFNLKRAYIQLKSQNSSSSTAATPITANNNNNKDNTSGEVVAQLKKKLAYLESELAEIDKESLQRDFQFKEVEVLKIHPDMIATLLDISRNSQRTCFLVVHPKTMQVKDVRTDVRQHQIQARRDAGVA